MFDKQLESLCQEINRHHQEFKQLQQRDNIFREFISAENLIDKFLQSQNRIWQSSVLNVLIRESKYPRFQQYCYTLITRLFWRNLTYLSTDCTYRQLTTEDMFSQANLLLLEQINRLSQIESQEKVYINITKNIRREFYKWVDSNDFQFSELSESQTEIDINSTNTESIIKRIILSKVLTKSDIEFYLDILRDGRKISQIAKDRNIKPNTLRKKVQRIVQKMSRFHALNK